MYDITNSWSFDNIPKWKKTFLDRSMVSQPENFPFMLIGNKLDLEDEARAVTKLQAEEWCAVNGNIDFLETSARDNKNIEEAFIKLASKALKRQVEM